MYSPLALFSSSFRASWARVAFKWLLQPETFSPHRQFYLQRENEPAYMELAPSIGSLVLREFGSIFPPVRNKKRNGCPRNTTKRAPPHVESIDFPIRDIVSFSLPAKQMPPKRAIINLMQWRKLWPLPFMKTSASDNFFPPPPPPLPCAKIERGNSADKGLLPHYRHISPLGHNWGRPRSRDLRGHGLHASARH